MGFVRSKGIGKVRCNYILTYFYTIDSGTMLKKMFVGLVDEKNKSKKQVTILDSSKSLLANEGVIVFMRREDKSFFAGVVISVVVSLFLYILLKYGLELSVFVGIIAGILVGLIVNEVKK